jgi:hypothetical protein
MINLILLMKSMKRTSIMDKINSMSKSEYILNLIE